MRLVECHGSSCNGEQMVRVVLDSNAVEDVCQKLITVMSLFITDMSHSSSVSLMGDL